MSDWYQQSLTPPEVVEVRCRIGAIPSTDHLQALVEVLDPMTGVLIGQWSYPHARLRQMGGVVEWATTTMRKAVEDTLEPF